MQVLTSGELATARAADIGLLVVRGAGDINRHELGCALAICGDIARQALTHLMHGKGQLVEGVRALDNRLRICGSAGSKHDAGVVSRGVGIDCYLVEGLFDGREQQGVESLRLDGASVVMTAIMVAMLGMIMPEPLHIPPTV